MVATPYVEPRVSPDWPLPLPNAIWLESYQRNDLNPPYKPNTRIYNSIGEGLVGIDSGVHGILKTGSANYDLTEWTTPFTLEHGNQSFVLQKPPVAIRYGFALWGGGPRCRLFAGFLDQNDYPVGRWPGPPQIRVGIEFDSSGNNRWDFVYSDGVAERRISTGFNNNPFPIPAIEINLSTPLESIGGGPRKAVLKFYKNVNELGREGFEKPPDATTTFDSIHNTLGKIRPYAIIQTLEDSSKILRFPQEQILFE